MKPIQRQRKHRSWGTHAVLILILAAAAAPSAAAERFRVRVFAVDMTPSSDQIRFAAPPVEPVFFALGGGSSVGVELEYLWRPRVAFELMMSFGDYQAELGSTPGGTPRSVGDLGSETYTLGINYRFALVGRTELWAGAFGGFSYYDDVTLILPASGQSKIFRFDDDLGFGVKVGFDLPVEKSGQWLVSGSLRYLSSILEGEEAGRDMDVDPLSVTLGVGYRF